MIVAYSKTPVTRTSEGMFLKLLLPVCKMEMPSQAAPPGLSDARGLGAGGDQRQLCSLPLCPGLTGWRLVLPTPVWPGPQRPGAGVTQPAVLQDLVLSGGGRCLPSLDRSDRKASSGTRILLPRWAPVCPGCGLPESREMDPQQHVHFWASPPTSPQGPRCQNHRTSHRRVSSETSEKFT